MSLKKMWESVLNRSRRHSNVIVSEKKDFESCTEFDRLPYDAFLEIMKRLGPKGAARASLVCRQWKILISEDQLWIFFLQNQNDNWESIIFAETHLRLGKSRIGFSAPLYQQVYCQRSQLRGSIIIDGGSGYCKYGWSKYSGPSGRSATFLEFDNIESPVYSRLCHFFTTIFSRMQVRASTYPVIVSVPICHYDDTESAKASRKLLKDTIYSVLFDMNVPAVCAINQATLALYSANRTSGIVVNIGFRITSIVPILHGKVMRKIGVEIMGQGALKLTGFLREMMEQKGISFRSLYTVRTLKEELCYVALDYEAEISKHAEFSLEIPGEGVYTLSQERFQAAEILFQPQMGGVRTMALHYAIALCMDHCLSSKVASNNEWFKTVVLAGGTSCLPGLPERLEKELHEILPPSMSKGIEIIPPSYGVDSAWFGAKTISNLSTFKEVWCLTKKQFHKKYKRGSSLLSSW